MDQYPFRDLNESYHLAIRDVKLEEMWIPHNK
jgi:hypothetical protein